VTPSEGELSARFSASGALGYAWVIFRSRPVNFLRLAGLQALMFAALSFAMFWVMGWGGLETSGGVEMQAARMLRAIALMTAVYPFMLILTIWIEAMWLDLFFGRTPRLWPGWGDYGRLLVSFLIVFAIFMAGCIGVLFTGGIFVGLVAALGGVGPAIVVGLGAFASFLVFLLLVQMRLSAFPGLVFRNRRINLALAWRLSRGRLGALTLAWAGFAGLYVVLMIPAVLVFAFMPVGPFEALRLALENPDDPFAQYRAYAPLVRDPGAAWLTFALLVVTNLIFTPVMAMSRAIGVRLALEDEAE